MAWADIRSEVEGEFGALRERQQVELFGAYERIVARRNAHSGTRYRALTREQKKRNALRVWSRRARKRLSARAPIRCKNPRCDAVFVPWYATTKYCTDACRHRHDRARHYQAQRSKQLATRAATTCRGCGKSFLPWRTNVFNCSERCGYLELCERRRLERGDKPERRQRLCAHCGQLFKPSRTNVINCSRACALETERVRARDRMRARRRRRR